NCDLACCEESSGDSWKHRRDARRFGGARNVINAAETTLFRGCEHQAACSELEVEKFADIAAGLDNQVVARDAGVCGSVCDELRNVLGANEDALECSAQ